MYRKTFLSSWGGLLIASFVLTAAAVMPASAWAASSAAVAAMEQSAIKVSGTVTDENGEPLIGASVFVKGTTDGVITDMDGKFTLNMPADAILTVSYIGYLQQEVVVGNRNSITVTLQPDTTALEEVVVIGYGTVKKKDLTGSVASVRGEVLEARKTTALSNALQGSMPGLMVRRDNGAPGSEASSIHVRGVTTMGDSSPLIIVDGVQVENINYVNANDVESISVLKDAAAASIYGAKAAAGVILITTKRGSATDFSFTYNGEFGWEMPTTKPQMVGVTRYMEMANEMAYNDNNGGGFYQKYTADQVKNWVAYNAMDPDTYPITDWEGLMMNDSAMRQTHTVSVSGGNRTVRTKATLSYDDVDALYPGRKFQRYMLRTNNDFTIIKDILYATLDVNIRRGKNRKPVYDPFSDMRKMPAIYPAIWENGGIASGKDGANPYGQLFNNSFDTSWSTQIGGKASIEVRPVKGLSIQAVIAPFIKYTKTKKYTEATNYVSRYDADKIEAPLSGFGETKLEEARKDSYNVTSQVIANYHNTFGRHNLNVMAGYENYVMKSEELNASRGQYELPGYPYLNVGNKDFQLNSGKGNEYTSNSVFGRIMYDYDNRYLIQANVRHDGSSRFARKYRWGTFPSVSAGWAISEEKFMKSTRNWLSFLKVRASWGMLGNERIGDSYYPYMSLMNFNSALFYDEDGNVVSEQTAAMKNLAVEDISWETTTSTDVGIDMAFFNSRLRANFDYYWKTTTDMLLDIQIPNFMGYGTPKTNAGTMSTHGFDLELGWNDRVGEFAYNITFNLSDFQSKVDYMNNGESIKDGKIKRAGLYFNEWYGLMSDGLFQTQEEIDAYPHLEGTQPGDIKYIDYKKDGIINDEDRVPLGNSLPRFQYGGTIGMGWRGIDFSLAFQGIGRQLSMIHRNMVEIFRDNYGNVPALIDGKYWSRFNTAEQNLKAEYPRLTDAQKSNQFKTSDFWLFNGAYFRLKNITLGYTFPEKWMSKAKIQKLRVYASASDLFSISRWPQGWDPEMGVTNYPITTSVLLGLSITF
jgi:tonB-linked outer membrane protein, susC/ragA family